MASVAVIGGGIAGMAAAARASSLGSTVTLIEGSEKFGRPRSDYILLLTGEVREEDLGVGGEGLRKRLGIETLSKCEVRLVDTKKQTLHLDGSKMNYDQLVIATGGSARKEQLPTKGGVHFMDTPRDYVSLAEATERISSAAVTGSVPLALRFAEVLVGKGIRVSFFGSPPVTGYFPDPIQRVVEGRLAANGVKVIHERVERVAGLGKVEAVVSGGSVYPCEALVVVPDYVPRTPEIDAKRGSSGGLIVDAGMRTSESGVYAAGECAEMAIGGSSFSMRQQPAARIMGEVAGGNASGGSQAVRLSGAHGMSVFGLELCSAGLTLAEARRAGFDAIESSHGSGGGKPSVEDSVCSLVYDRVGKTVYGLQIAGGRALAYGDFASVVVTARLRLDDLAYLETAYVPGVSRGESPVATTAKRALSG